MIKNKDTESIYGLTEEDMKVIGLMENSTEKVLHLFFNH